MHMWICTHIMICKTRNWTKNWIVKCIRLYEHHLHNVLIHNFSFHLPLIPATRLLRFSSHKVETSWSVKSATLHYPPAHMLTPNRCLKNRYTPYIQVFYHLNCGLWCGYDAVAYAYYSKGHLIVTEPLLNKYADDSLQEKLKNVT